MRSLVLLAALPLLGAAPPSVTQAPATRAPATQAAVPAPLQPPAQMPQNPYGDEACPETPMSLARKQGERLRARPLGELPPAEAFAAVDRRVDGCAAPMLMTEVRAR